MTLSTDSYELDLATSGKLKLRATARLAEGGEEAAFEACVLLHDAARVERRAVDGLLAAPATTRLAASIEECWLLVEGRDPPRAADAWGRVLREKEAVAPDAASAMLERLGPAYEKSARAFKKVVAECASLRHVRGAGALVPATAREREALLGDVHRVLEVFPGSASFWWASYRLRDAGGDANAGWDALQRARRLDPENRRFEAMAIFAAARTLAPRAADDELGRVRGSLDVAGPEVCLMYALAELGLTKRSPDRGRVERALDAASAGLVQARTEVVRKNLKAAQLIALSLLAGREPTVDVLYVAGLGQLVTMAPPRQSPLEVLTDFATERLGGASALDEAA